MKRKNVFWTVVMLGLLIGGTTFYLSPRLVPATPLSNSSGEPRSLSDLVNFTKISSLKESTLTPLSTDWENALSTIQQYPGTAPVYSEACSKYSCPGGIPVTLTGTPQTILPQKGVPSANDNLGKSVSAVGTNFIVGVPGNATLGLSGAGAAYLFDSSGNLLASYHEPTPGANDNFGISVAGVGGNILIGSNGTIVGGFSVAGAAYLFDSSGNLLHTYHEPTSAANDNFGYSLAGVGGNVLIGSYGTTVGGFANAGAAYLFDSSGNLLAAYHEPTPAAGDRFGSSVAAVGGNILIGSYLTTAGGFSGAGAAYLFDSSGNLLRTYHEPTPAVIDGFGISVAGVGGSILIGSFFSPVGMFGSAGAAYLFDSSGNLLHTYHEPTLSNDEFGISVAGVGVNILIGSLLAPAGSVFGAGAAYLFDSSGNLLAAYHEPTPAAGDRFGSSVAAVGGNILIGSYLTTAGGFSGAGAAYLFDNGGNLLRTIQKMTRPGNGLFGYSLTGVGGNLIVGSPGDSNNAGTAYIVDSSGIIVRMLRKPVPVANDNFGLSVTSVGSNIAVGAPYDSTLKSNAGAVYLFDGAGNLLATLRKPGAAASDFFGLSVASVGTNILVGVPFNATAGLSGAGAAYLFDSGGNLLRGYREPVPGVNDNFGYSVAGVGGNILIGSPFTAVGGLATAGAAYLFDSNGNLLAIFHEPTPQAGDNFGLSLAPAGGNVLIGSPFSNTASPNAGAAYLYNSGGNLLRAYQEPTSFKLNEFGFSVAGVGGNILIGSPYTKVGVLTSAGAAYLFDSNGNLLKSFHEPNTAASDNFGYSVAGVGGNVLIGSPHSGVGGFSQPGAAYFYRQFGLRDACAAATGPACLVVGETGSFQAGPNTVAMNVVAVSLRSARNATGVQMDLTVMCNQDVTDAGLGCFALYVDGNLWAPGQTDITKSPFLVQNAQPYFYLQFHWWDPVDQVIVPWGTSWYGTNVNPNWYWTVYLWWRTYVSYYLGTWQPYWWWAWHWLYWRNWWQTTPFQTS